MPCKCICWAYGGSNCHEFWALCSVNFVKILNLYADVNQTISILTVCEKTWLYFCLARQLNVLSFLQPQMRWRKCWVFHASIATWNLPRSVVWRFTFVIITWNSQCKFFPHTLIDCTLHKITGYFSCIVSHLVFMLISYFCHGLCTKQALISILC